MITCTNHISNRHTNMYGTHLTIKCENQYIVTRTSRAFADDIVKRKPQMTRGDEGGVTLDCVTTIILRVNQLYVYVPK